MTTYVNEEKQGYGKAVKATLAATLAAGMVPAAAAFADEPQAETVEDPQIDLLVATEAFTNAEIVKVFDNKGKELKVNAQGEYALNEVGYVSKVTFKLADGKGTEVTVENGNEYKFSYVKGKKNAGDFAAATEVDHVNKINESGSYTLKVEPLGADGTSTGEAQYVNFALQLPVAAADVALVAATSATTASSDIVFSGKTIAAAFGDKDTTVEAGEFALNVDGVMKAITAFDVFAANDTATKIVDSSVLYAGDYVAKITYDGGSAPVMVKFSVAKFDLANASVVAKDKKADTYTVATSDLDIAGGFDETALRVSYDPAKNNGISMPNAAGEYTYTLALADGKASDAKFAASVNGTKDFTVKFVTAVVEATGFKYNNEQITQSAFDKLTEFDPALVSVDGVNRKLVDVKVYDVATGKVVTDWTAAGAYKVVVKVNDPTFQKGGSASATFKVAAPTVAADGVYVSYKGKLVAAHADGNGKGHLETTYDGSNLVKDIAVKVNKGNKTLTEGVDYKLVYTKANKEVAEVVDAGSYLLTIKPITFKFTEDEVNNGANTVVIDVDTVKLSTLRVADEVTVTLPDPSDPSATVTYTGLPYTGAAIEPVLEYDTGKKDANGDAIFAEVPAGICTVMYKAFSNDHQSGVYVDQVVEANDPADQYSKYQVEVVLKSGVTNYELTNATDDFKVIKASRFLDVPSGHNLYNEVNAAAAKGWIKGLNNGDFFAPDKAITRGDVCMIVARKAGVKLVHDTHAGDVKYFATPFDDVDGYSYYAEAVAWAANAGIVKGDDNTGNFRPEDEITRSEFAAIMMRFAKMAGDTTVADETVLNGYTDAADVPSWFTAEVAWAVESGIMGVNTPVLMPVDDITRAQVAAMAVRLA